MDRAESSSAIETYLSRDSFFTPTFRPDSAWIDHGPFAFWVIQALRPRTLVELGTHGGYSYFAFCEAVKNLGLDTRCFAVDTWEGDEHAGFYTEEFFDRVSGHNAAHYSQFSRLVRATFDDALAHFSDGSIDLLHIDGRHFYEDVKHDFEAWRPKLSDRAVVLFHDTNVRERDFGVFRLWESLRDSYPSFEFFHGHGLGVLAYGKNAPPTVIDFLTVARDPRVAADVRRAYGRLGETFKIEAIAAKRVALLTNLTQHAEALKVRGDTLDGVVADLTTRLLESTARGMNLEDQLKTRCTHLENQLKTVMGQAEAQDQRNIALEDEIKRTMINVSGLHAHIATLTSDMAAKVGVIAAMHNSTSWKLTAPIRSLRRGPGGLMRRARMVMMDVARALYRYVPIPLWIKRSLTHTIFRATGGLFRRTRAYQEWDRMYRADLAVTAWKRAAGGRKLKEVAREPADDYSTAVPFGYAADPGAPRTAAICHIYYDNIAPEIQRYLRHIPFGFDVYISTNTEAKKAVIESIFRDWDRGKVEVRIAPNRGRDIAPKLIAFRDVYPNYDYVLHLHSKASKHAGVLACWRGYAYETLLGSPAIVASIFDAFRRRPDLGIIAGQHFEVMRHWINWGDDFRLALPLAERMGFPLAQDKVLDFPSGSMFWARTAALKPLLDLNLAFEDFDAESGQIDATTAHAIERLYFYVCEHAGYGWLKIANPELLANTPAIVPIAAPADLDQFIAEHGLKLSGANLPAPRLAHPTPVYPPAGLIARLQEGALGVDQVIDTAADVRVGVVTYNNDDAQVGRILASARKALARAGLGVAGRVMVMDNGAPSAAGRTPDVTVLPSEGNIGFGAAHNRLMQKAAVTSALYVRERLGGVQDIWEVVAKWV